MNEFLKRFTQSEHRDYICKIGHRDCTINDGLKILVMNEINVIGQT